MNSGLLCLVVLVLAVGAQALTPTHHLTASDVARLEARLGQPFTDLQSAYFSIVGRSKLGVTVADSDVSIDPNVLSVYGLLYVRAMGVSNPHIRLSASKRKEDMNLHHCMRIIYIYRRHANS